jgi:GntR family transcriptional regulator
MLYIYSKSKVVSLTIIVSLQSEIPAYEQIKVQIKAQILSGELTADEPLTSMRQLARDLRVSVITTTRAYGDLEAEGLIYTVQGRGCFVKGNANLIREQYLLAVDEALRTAADKGKAAGLTFAELQNKLEGIYNDQRD